ncbi:MAG: HSP90 family protein [Deferribacteraceae bacterium]|nr:HSP90 family protein [Deferribacteraceae bacterium]
MQDSFRFQVNMGGIIDLFSQHLYSSPKVFARELLQNAVDAVTARSLQEPAAPRDIYVRLFTGAQTRIEVEDSGTGLTLEEIHQFLSIIGESSKRNTLAGDDFIGRFGVGLLSGFLVSEELELYTRSAKSDKGYLWKAMQNGTYAIEEADVDRVGSTVVLRRKGLLYHEGADRDSFDNYFDPETLRSLLSFYGDILPYPIYYQVDGGSVAKINEMSPPWLTPSISSADEIMQFGEDYFGERFMGYIPLKSTAGGVEGVAYIVNRRVNAGAMPTNRVYLRNMLLTEAGKGLLPDWAFFLRAVVNTQNLRPTASREDFYKDELLEKTQDELGVIIKQYIKEMATRNPAMMDRFIVEHSLALKSLAIDDEEILNAFIDYFPFETSLGNYSFAEIRQLAAHKAIKYVSKVDQFRQLSPVFGASARLLVNAGYVYDSELMEAIAYYRSDISVERLSPEDALFEMEDLEPAEADSYDIFIKNATEILKKWGCVVSVKKYQPIELPALLLINDEASFVADLRYSKESSSDLFADILDKIDKSFASADIVLCLNANNRLVQRLAERELYDETVLDLLYVQSTLLARRPLRSEEMRVLNTGILSLIERAL